ncbi:helix-turn-helix domain-containing protein [Enterococcus sp. AD013-P3]|uniref:helix-turn-helix domain-containing protein n=1 Tax=Enterococcus sp. AD013-P3 TaxID=3411036 RepID=UPI003B92262F
MLTIGSRLKSLRQQRGWSQLEVAEKLRISRQSISKWELDKSLPDVGMLKELAMLYDFSLDELLQLQEERIMALNNLKTEELVADSGKILCRDQAPTQEQQDFLATEIFEPIATKLLPEKILWQTVLLAVPVGVSSNLSSDKAVTKKATHSYQKLFDYDNGIYLFMTESGLWRTTAVDWLETSKLIGVPFSAMDVLVIAPFFEARLKQGNLPGLFYGKTDGGYDMLAISKQASENLARLLKVLDPKQHLYHSYQNHSTTEILKLWRKKKRLPTE